MTHEYDDPISEDAVEDAVRLAASLRAQRPSASAAMLATEAVNVLFCTCVTSAADACAPPLAPTHAGLITEVARRLRSTETGQEKRLVASDPVDLASEDSFPASDPPGWIWRRSD